MKIVIVGGAGFIGKKLTSDLVSRGYEVLIIDNYSRQIHGDQFAFNLPEDVKLARVDILDMPAYAELLEGADAIFHLVAETGTGQSMYQISRYTAVNCLGTAALLEAISKTKVKPKRLILSSSRSVYGEGAYAGLNDPNKIIYPQTRSHASLSRGEWELKDSNAGEITPIPTPESSPFSPVSLYAATKASQELLLMSAAQALGFELLIFRFQNVYGEGQSLQNPYTGIISIFLNRARQGLPISIFEDGQESRDFIHVSDVVHALVNSVDAPLPPLTIMNLGSGIRTAVIDLARTLLTSSGLKVDINITGQFRVGDIRHCFADLTLAKQYLGFKPKVSLSDGLSRFSSWALNMPAYQDHSEKAMSELRANNLAK